MAQTQIVRSRTKRSGRVYRKKTDQVSMKQTRRDQSLYTKLAKKPSAQIHSTLTGTRIFDRSLHKTNAWIKELMVSMKWSNRDKTLNAFRATLHSLRDILPLQEIPQLASQFPILIRGLYYENWRLSKHPLKVKSIQDFYQLVRQKLGRGAINFSSDDLQKFTRFSLQLISKHVSKGEIKDVKNSLKENLKVLFDEGEYRAFVREIESGHKKTRKRRKSTKFRPAQVH